MRPLSLHNQVGPHMSDDESIAYWHPQVMRHTHRDGRMEYAFHDVYFSHDGSVITYTTYTVHARSERMATVAELEAWLRSTLSAAGGGIGCGDLGYTHDADDLALWLRHIGDPPTNYETDNDKQ